MADFCRNPVIDNITDNINYITNFFFCAYFLELITK